MSDFGNAGKRNVHVSEAAATIDATAGDSIVCTVDAKGATPVFTFDCTHRTGVFAPAGPPQPRYQWSVYDVAGTGNAMGDVHTLTLRFNGGATSYHYRMELFDANFALKKVLKDVEYETSDPADIALEPIALRTK